MQEPIGDQKRCSEFRKYIIKLRDQLIAEGIESLRAVKCNNTNLCDTVRETSSNPFGARTVLLRRKDHIVLLASGAGCLSTAFGTEKLHLLHRGNEPEGAAA